MGMYDIPAELEYVLNVTGRQKLIYIGHSMGIDFFISLWRNRLMTGELI